MQNKEDRLKILATKNDGEILAARENDSGISISTYAPIPEGQPFNIHNEVITLERRDDGDFDVTVAWRQDVKGPAKVSNNSYRNGWDVIWGQDKKSLN